MFNKVSFVIIFSILIAIIACNKDQAYDNDDDIVDTSMNRSISLQNSYDLQIDEPSGLSFYKNGTLLSVDDNTNQIFNITKDGQALSTLTYIGDDLEGVTYNPISNKIYIVHEAERKLIELDSNANKLNEWSFNVPDGSDNNGFEGLSMDYENDIFYILNETSPGLLIVWDYKNETIIEEITLNFATDYSGVFYDNSDKSLWFVSDKSKKIFHTNMKIEIIESFDIDYEKGEGIVVDSQSNTIYVARDYQSNVKLYVYNITKIN